MRIPFWVRYRLNEWRRRWPLVLRKTRDADVARAREDGRRQVTDDLTEERKTLRTIIDRLVQIQYRRIPQGRTYQMTVAFDPTLFAYGPVDRGQQDYIARDIARRVEHEIATSKFIREAEQAEMRYGPMGRFP